MDIDYPMEWEWIEEHQHWRFGVWAAVEEVRVVGCFSPELDEIHFSQCRGNFGLVRDTVTRVLSECGLRSLSWLGQEQERAEAALMAQQKEERGFCDACRDDFCACEYDAIHQIEDSND